TAINQAAKPSASQAPSKPAPPGSTAYVAIGNRTAPVAPRPTRGRTPAVLANRYNSHVPTAPKRLSVLANHQPPAYTSPNAAGIPTAATAMRRTREEAM